MPFVMSIQAMNAMQSIFLFLSTDFESFFIFFYLHSVTLIFYFYVHTLTLKHHQYKQNLMGNHVPVYSVVLNFDEVRADMKFRYVTGLCQQDIKI